MAHKMDDPSKVYKQQTDDILQDDILQDDKAISDDIMDQLHFQLENEHAKSEVTPKDTKNIDDVIVEEDIYAKSNLTPEISITENPESFTPIEELPGKEDEEMENLIQNCPEIDHENSMRQSDSCDKHTKTNEENFSYYSVNELDGLVTPVKKSISPTEPLAAKSGQNQDF